MVLGHGRCEQRARADRWPEINFSSIAAIGFGLTAYGVGAERGWVTREQARDRTLTTLRFLWAAPQSGEPRGRHRISRLLLPLPRHGEGPALPDGRAVRDRHRAHDGGVLFAQSYLIGDDPAEREIRVSPTSCIARVEWNWMQPRPPLIAMAWRPEAGHDAARLQRLRGGDDPLRAGARIAEARDFAGRVEGPHRQLQVGHLLRPAVHQLRAALHPPVLARLDRFPRHPRRLHARERASTTSRTRAGPPTRSAPMPSPTRRLSRLRREHVGIHRLHGPRDAKGPSTAGRCSSTPTGRAAPAAATSATTAPSRRRPRAARCRSRPRSCPGARRRCGARHGARAVPALWVRRCVQRRRFPLAGLQPRTGVVHPEGWFTNDYLGIDQGPIVLMAENHRSGLVWPVMKKNPHIVRGLCRAGFTGGWLTGRCE